jgi:hypothetical protein
MPFLLIPPVPGLLVEVALTILSLSLLGAKHAFALHPLLDDALTSVLITLMLFVAAFLVILNASFAVVSRNRRPIEVLSFIAVGLLELVIFGFVLVLRLGILTHVPLTLPPGLPINRAEIGATLALAIGLLPSAYWHRMSMSQLRERMAEDAKVIKNREGGVRIRGNAPGEWLN